ncbi:MAG: pirin family protein [Myxococcota bacterium]
MSLRSTIDPKHEGSEEHPVIELRLESKPRDLGGFSVRRVLPSEKRRALGPFVFFDHMGPAEFGPGSGINVRPHPHIHLATITYLFEGEIVHRDSLGSHQTIQAGAVNLMVAGKGIVHSERTSPELWKSTYRLHGLQLWIALPQASEDTEPDFHHHPASELPEINTEAARMKVIMGRAFGKTSPVKTFSPTFYVDLSLKAGARMQLPNEYEERGLYLISGSVRIGQEELREPQMLLLKPDAEVFVEALEDARLVALGGDPLGGPRHIFWNFVSSSPERIKKASEDWKASRFPEVPGDNEEFIPLPEA